jgi:hypothetical protein
VGNGNTDHDYSAGDAAFLLIAVGDLFSSGDGEEKWIWIVFSVNNRSSGIASLQVQ